jgi:proteasome assembly chaperone (PAC2) family protein
LGDHGSAKALLELLIKKFHFKLNLQELGKEAKNIEEAFQKLTQQLKEQVEQDNPKLSYVR